MFRVMSLVMCLKVLLLVFLAMRDSAGLSRSSYSYLLKNAENPKAQVKTAKSVNARRTKPTIKDLIRFGPSFTKILEGLYGKHLPITDKNMTFNESADSPLVGSINFTRGILTFASPFKFKDVNAYRRGTRYDLAVMLIYKLAKLDVLLEFQYLVNIPSESMNGFFNVSLRNFDIVGSLVVVRFDNGTCYFSSPSLFPDQVDKDYDYKAIFYTERGFKDSGLTKRMEAVINTIVLKSLFDFYLGAPEFGYEGQEKIRYQHMLTENLC